MTVAAIHVAGPADAAAVAALRAGGTVEPGFADRLAGWLRDEGDRRTIWLATVDGDPVGMVSLLEYRRMPTQGRPDARWGYVGNAFVREDTRRRGIGTALVATVAAAADGRGYVRLVVSPSAASRSLWERAGFVIAGTAGAEPLLVRSG